MSIRAVLWDADGVLQDLPPFEQLWSFLTPDLREVLLADVFAEMSEVLTGTVDMATRLERAIERHRLEDYRESIEQTWRVFPPIDQARALLAGVRRSGLTCVLATNQDNLRERHMRPVYEPLLDRLYFSSALGVAKPEESFFRAIGQDLGLDLDELLFVDDSVTNVDGARAAGLPAEVWHHTMGIEDLEERLARHGVAAS